MDPSEVGKFGTLHLMKRLDPNQVVASYPIDDDELTIGRDQDCSIRLYYDAVSPQHCKIIFHERKAYIVVLGTSGVLIDGCPVFPTSSSSSPQVTVPLPNNSTIEVNKKRFLFCYPPKELRAMMISTPSRPDEAQPDRRHRRKTLRMSMIQSAQVFTPGPSQDPRENLRILKTPLKPAFPSSNRRQSSPLKRGMFRPTEEEEEEDEDEIVLVETNHPKVVEEERDLVILEEVEVEEPIQEPVVPQQQIQLLIPPAAQAPPQTPRRRAGPRASLHRAVLIRSAQRAALRYEMEREEEEEVEEVEDTIGEPEEMEDVQEVDEEEDTDEDEEMAEVEPEQAPRGPVSGWRKSLNAMKEGLGWAFRASSVPREADEEDHQHEQEEEEEEEEEVEVEEAEEEQDITDAEPATSEEVEDDAEELFAYYDSQKSGAGPSNEQAMDTQEHPDPPGAPLGQFMTPQPSRTGREKGFVRHSAGGFVAGSLPVAGARRVKVVEPWKVADIVIEEPKVKEEREQSQVPPATPVKRERLTEEEKQAIRERRKSALTTPDAFFGGQTPGSRKFSHLQSLSPKKGAPIAALSVVDTIHEVKDEEEEDAEEDTQVMLAKMKQMVEGVKRRQSMGARPSIGPGSTSPRKTSGFSLLALEGEEPRGIPRREIVEVEEDDDDDDDGDKENVQQNEDVEMVEDEEFPSHPQAGTRQPTTPKFTGVRELFREAAEEMHTPQMDGLRNLFRPERVAATPAFEGLGEMLAIPAAYQEEPPIPKLDLKAALQKPKAAPAKSTQTRKPPSITRVPAPRRPATRTPAPRIESPVETIPEEPEPSGSGNGKAKAVATRVTRKPRSKTIETNEAVGTSGKASKTRSATATKEVEQEEPAAEPVRDRTRSGGSSKSASPEETNKPIARRTRKVPEPPAAEEAPAPAPTRSLRKPRSTSKTPVPEEKPPSKTSTTRRKAGAKTLDVDMDEDDPLDTLSASKKATGSRVRRSARSKVDTIKEEDHNDDDGDDEMVDSSTPVVEEEKPVVAPRTRTTTRKTTTTATSSIPKKVPPATTSRATASRARAIPARKVPASEPAKRGGAKTPGDKENTPEADDEEPEAGPSGKSGTKPSATKAKTVRSTAKTRAAAEQALKEAEPAKPIATRVSRTRATRK